jgi:hypothetical protein
MQRRSARRGCGRSPSGTTRTARPRLCRDARGGDGCVCEKLAEGDVDVQDLHGLRENIFRELRNSEYFLFVDFKRDPLGDTGLHRGSLFSNQELAVASLLEIDVVAFREKGVKPLDGLMQFLQVNAKEFSDKSMLPDAVVGVIQQRGWKSNWKNELALSTTQPVDYGGAMCFHVNVCRHRDKLATNCFAYLEKVIKRPDTDIPVKTIEFKWAATYLPSVSIAAQTERQFDVFFIMHTAPDIVLFQVHTDTMEYRPKLPQQLGTYELTYAVTSANFPTARAKLILDLRKSAAKTSLTLVP